MEIEAGKDNIALAGQQFIYMYLLGFLGFQNEKRN